MTALVGQSPAAFRMSASGLAATPVGQHLGQSFVVDLEHLRRPSDAALGTDAFLTVDPYLKTHVQTRSSKLDAATGR